MLSEGLRILQNGSHSAASVIDPSTGVPFQIRADSNRLRIALAVSLQTKSRDDGVRDDEAVTAGCD